MMAAEAVPQRLPMWRAITGFGVLGALVAVLLLLAPVYVQNSRFSGRVKALVAASEPTPGPGEDALRQKLVAEGAALGLPVLPGEIKFSRAADSVEVQVRYRVRRNLGVYQVDLHFHPSGRVALPAAGSTGTR